MKRPLAWVVGAVVGIVVGTATAFGVQGWQESREASDLDRRIASDQHEDVVPAPVDAIRELLAQDSLVVVDPLLADRVSAEDLQRAEEVLASSPVPARIAYLSYPDGLDVGYTASGAGPQWWTNVGEVGHYAILWDNGSAEVGSVGLEPDYLADRTEGQPGPALERIAAEMATWEAVPLDDAPYEPGDFDYWEGVGGGLAAALLFGGLGVVPGFLLLRWYVGTRRREVG